MRKLLVIIIAFLAVLAIYLLYLRFVPAQQAVTGAEDIKIADINAPTENAGKIGDVEVESVVKARYVTINPETQSVEREYGFARLLHESGSEWEIEQPYMIIYSGDSTVKFTADKGTVQLDTSSRTPTPKDAELTGNVVIKIDRADSSQTTYIYFDKISFIGDQSLFSTDGPVKVENPQLRLEGRVVRMVYNELNKRLEYLRIIELEKLSFNDIFFEPSSSSKEATAESPAAAKATGDTKTDVDKKPLYQLVFDRSVLINAPQQRIFTDRLSIENIMFGSSGRKKSTTGQPSATEDKPDVSGEPNTAGENNFDVILTCDNGIFVRPMNSDLFSLPDVQQIGDIESGGKQTLFVADKITGDMSAQRLTAYRPSIDFLADNFIEPNGESILPVNVTCEKMDFLNASDRLVFTGDVRCKMTEQLPQGLSNEYTLDAPRLTLNLGSKGANDAAPFSVEHVTADKGVVQLAVVKKEAGDVFGGVALKCMQFDYNSLGQAFIATGPGLIKIDNSNAADRDNEKNGRKISLSRRCYALIEDFSVLRYELGDQRITADSDVDEGEFISIGYVPVTDKGSGDSTNISAGHIDARFMSVDNRTELSDVYASDGVSFEDGKNIFSGSELLYNGAESMLYVNGSETMPAILNGGQVDGIEYNMKTGRKKAKLINMSILGQN